MPHPLRHGALAVILWGIAVSPLFGQEDETSEEESSADESSGEATEDSSEESVDGGETEAEAALPSPRRAKRRSTSLAAQIPEGKLVRYFEFDAYNWRWQNVASDTTYPAGTRHTDTSETTWASVYNSYFALSLIGRKGAFHLGRNHYFEDATTIAYGFHLPREIQLGPTLEHAYSSRESESDGVVSKSKTHSYHIGAFANARIRMGRNRLVPEGRLGMVYSESKLETDGRTTSDTELGGWFAGLRLSVLIPLTSGGAAYYMGGVSYSYRTTTQESALSYSETKESTHRFAVRLLGARLFF